MEQAVQIMNVWGEEVSPPIGNVQKQEIGKIQKYFEIYFEGNIEVCIYHEIMQFNESDM